MTFEVSKYEWGAKNEPEIKNGVHLGIGAKVYKTTFHGPCFVDHNCKIGPHVEIGRYTGFHDSSYASRCTIGAFCSFGSRNSINPFNHPTDWLSTHEFQYHNLSFFWIEEFQKLERAGREPQMIRRSVIGHDVWTGDNVIILNGVTIGNGVIIGAGSVVTKDIPHYAIVAGNPAKLIRMRFPEDIIVRLQRVEWWKLDLADLSGLPFNDVEACLLHLEHLRAFK